jgi:hypothetical protein
MRRVAAVLGGAPMAGSRSIHRPTRGRRQCVDLRCLRGPAGAAPDLVAPPRRRPAGRGSVSTTSITPRTGRHTVTSRMGRQRWRCEEPSAAGPGGGPETSAGPPGRAQRGFRAGAVASAASPSSEIGLPVPPHNQVVEANGSDLRCESSRSSRIPAAGRRWIAAGSGTRPRPARGMSAWDLLAGGRWAGVPRSSKSLHTRRLRGVGGRLHRVRAWESRFPPEWAGTAR